MEGFSINMVKHRFRQLPNASWKTMPDNSRQLTECQAQFLELPRFEVLLSKKASPKLGFKCGIPANPMNEISKRYVKSPLLGIVMETNLFDSLNFVVSWSRVQQKVAVTPLFAARICKRQVWKHNLRPQNSAIKRHSELTLVPIWYPISQNDFLCFSRFEKPSNEKSKELKITEAKSLWNFA